MTGSATTIVNAKVFDGVRSRSWTSVRFVDGFISDCSDASAAQEGDAVVDAGGGTVVPGLIDAHVHLVPGALAQSLRMGVTTVLDMFSTPDVVAAARIQSSTRSDVADVRSSGVGATAPGGHPSLIYGPFPTVVSADQAEAFVEERLEEGADYLKLFSGTGGRWPALDPESIGALVRAAHIRGLVVVAHVSSAAGVEEVVSAGADVLAHVPADVGLDAALVDRIAEAGIAVVPTLTTIEHTTRRSGGASHSQAEDTVRRLAGAGVTLLAGTDAPNPGTVFGAGLHRELELLVRSGLSAAEALNSATSAPARTFGLADRGRVDVGQRADLVLVSGDPTSDVTATRSIERVWRAGVPGDRRAFIPTAAEAEQLDAFDTRIASVVASVRDRRPI